MTGINLKGMFDHHGEEHHFWNTDAGKGQALAYAQQAAFTLELSLKAYLEVLGKLASTDLADIWKWRKHELANLFKLLTDDEKKQLEEWWKQSDVKRVHSEGSFREFLSASNKLYMRWRCITDLKGADLSMDIPMLLSASDFLLSASDRVFRKSSPIKVNITTTTHPSTEDCGGKPISRFSYPRCRFLDGCSRECWIVSAGYRRRQAEGGYNHDLAKREERSRESPCLQCGFTPLAGATPCRVDMGNVG